MCGTRSWHTYEKHLVSLRKSGVTQHMSGRDSTSLASGEEACAAVSIGPAKGGVHVLPCVREHASIPLAWPRRRAPRWNTGVRARLGRSGRYASTQARPKVRPLPWLHGVRTSAGLCTTINQSVTQLCADVDVRTHVCVSACARVRVCVRGVRACTRSARKNRALARRV
jgi:hypothetical protein